MRQDGYSMKKPNTIHYTNKVKSMVASIDTPKGI